MDPLTHALVIAIVLTLAGRPDLIPYGVAGAVLIDVDVLFGPLSNRYPGLYILTHGGFTHSFSGALLVALFVAIPAFFLSNFALMAPFGVAAFASIMAGALSHVALDYLAYPGIPLLYPFSDRKFTLGILGGPNPFLMLASIAYIAAMAAGVAQIGRPLLFIMFFAFILSLSAGAKARMAFLTKGWTVATVNPFRWAVIEDTPDSYVYYRCDLLGRHTTPETYAKYTGVTPEEARKNDGVPEVRRLRYHSYVVTAEADGRGTTYRDPLREKGHILYPPYYKTYHIPNDQP